MHRISFRKHIVPILMALSVLLASCATMAEPTVPDTVEPAIEESPSETEDVATTEISEEEPTADPSDVEETEPITPETDVAEESTNAPTPTMPFITEEHQGFTYGPGQRVTVIVEGFDPAIPWP